MAVGDYSRTTYVNGGVPAISAANLNNTEAKLDELDGALNGETDLPNNLKFANGKGIDFSAGSNAAGMTSELLDDYEEGTWTPYYSTGTTPPTTPFTMDIIIATYVKVGNLVTINAYMRTDSVDVTGCVGALVIEGLPFAPAAYSTAAITYANAWGANYPSGGHLSNATSRITLTYRDLSDGPTATNSAADLSAGITANQNAIMISATYTT